MQYTVLYMERGNGDNWYIRNNFGLYCAYKFEGVSQLRAWRDHYTASRFVNSLQRGCAVTWMELPKPAAAHKPTHGGYPARTAAQSSSFCAAYGGTMTGRFRSSVGHIEKAAASAPIMTLGELLRRKLEQQQPLVWPVISQADDGSNEEATTVPDALVAELSKRHYIIFIR